MLRRLSIRTDAATLYAVFFAVVLVSVPVHAEKKADLARQAQKAVDSGDLDEAARLYCELANLSPENSDANQNCSMFKHEAERERQKNEGRFTKGVQALKEGRLDDAEQEFRNVKSGPRLDEAKRYLGTIASARSKAETDKAQAEAEHTMEAKFGQAVQAYMQNDFASAKASFPTITGKHNAEAENYLGKITRYEQSMSQADSLATAKDFKGAAVKYMEAASIKSDGPGDPRAKADRMQAELSAVAQHPNISNPVSTVPSPASPSQLRRGNLTAAVTEAHAKLDVARLLREATKAKENGAVPLARGKYLAVLTADPGNKEARVALEQLKNESVISKEKAGADADIMLVKAIREFYTGEYENSEVHIKDYLGVNGAKTALSYFYLGASKVTRFYLGGEQDRDRRLLNEAREAFHNCKAEGFTPPNEKYVSPKILKAYQGS